MPERKVLRSKHSNSAMLQKDKKHRGAMPRCSSGINCGILQCTKGTTKGAHEESVAKFLCDMAKALSV